MKSVAGTIFDCDGTLVDTLSAHCASWISAFSKFSCAVPEDWFYKNCALPQEQFLYRFRAEFACSASSQDLVEKREQLFIHNYLPTVSVIETVATLARQLHGSMPLSVASNGNKLLVGKTLETSKLRSLFDVVVTIEDVKKGKPSPDLFLLAANKMKVEPDCCLVYEDSDEGLTAARLAGMRSIDVRDMFREH